MPIRSDAGCPSQLINSYFLLSANLRPAATPVDQCEFSWYHKLRTACSWGQTTLLSRTAMSKSKRSKKVREHRHSDLKAAVRPLTEDDLFSLLDGLARPPFLLILDNVQDPHNLGACLRSADGAGVDAVIVPKDRAAPITETVRLIACGAAESVPFVQVTNLARMMKQLQTAGVWLVGTADDAEKSLYDADLGGPLGLVLGSEGTGLRRLTRENCDLLVKIPMAGKVESLNVSVAAGICLYEVVRQRSIAKTL
ncbi:MAG: 23S rRNA (guanosine(2251)-2'-O)-methyltransferase RlmB [Candidatus Zixiibacteriota bacterium]|nr:MAG: 23S rRNA (guanosine(2251)-2'-O)-methyltransferase RlmB [candidate division Zixibacteria bacterium]